MELLRSVGYFSLIHSLVPYTQKVLTVLEGKMSQGWWSRQVVDRLCTRTPFVANTEMTFRRHYSIVILMERSLEPFRCHIDANCLQCLVQVGM